MRRNAVRFVLLFVSFCLWHFQPPHASFAQSPRQPKLLEQKLSEVSSDKVSDWIKVQIEDLGYASDIAEKVSEALSGYSGKALARASADNLLIALELEFPKRAIRVALARSLHGCIQRGAPQPQPLQPVSWQRSYVFFAFVRRIQKQVRVKNMAVYRVLMRCLRDVSGSNTF